MTFYLDESEITENEIDIDIDVEQLNKISIFLCRSVEVVILYLK